MTKTITDLSDVSVDDLDSIQGTRLLLHVDQGSARVAEWATENHEHVKRLLQANGALLIRGLKFAGSQQFGVTLATFFGAELLEYVYRSTPRTQLRGNVYTATEYHPSLQIPQHKKMPTAIVGRCASVSCAPYRRSRVAQRRSATANSCTSRFRMRFAIASNGMA
jgi:hypothetical protein